VDYCGFLRQDMMDFTVLVLLPSRVAE